MTFEEKVREFFKVGSVYKHVRGTLSTCTGFTTNTDCRGHACDRHPFFGICDGSIKPCFGEHKSRHCTYTTEGTDWFTKLEFSNERW